MGKGDAVEGGGVEGIRLLVVGDAEAHSTYTESMKA